MGLKDIFNKLTDKVEHEVNAAMGEEGKDKLFSTENEYETEAEARAAFQKSVDKLFYVNGWSDIGGINSTFTHYTHYGQPAKGKKAGVGDYIKIELPGAKIENWVQVVNIKNDETGTEFTVRPSAKPEEKQEPGEGEETKHFFTEEASSTFRVERIGTKIIAYELGLNEVINNDGEEAGGRGALNTLIAEGGWAFFQKLQWDKLTAYLVHKEGPDQDAD